MKFRNINLFTVMVVLAISMSSCNSDKKNSIEGDTNVESSEQKKSKKVALSTETIPNAKRLTDEAISSYFPDTFLGLEKSGGPKSKDMKNVESANTSIKQMYFQDGARASIMIEDMADDQIALNNFVKTQVGEEVDNTYMKVRNSTDANGIRVNEMEQYRDGNSEKIRTQSDVTISNARFRISISTSPKLEGEAMSTTNLLKDYKQSDLPKLMALPIPDIDSEQIAETEKSKYIDLDCNVLLPLQTVEKICGKAKLKLNVGGFEQDNNCNRTYTIDGTSASVVFIITQYSRNALSNSAVDVQGKGKEKRDGDIEGLGDSAHIETAGGGNLFLTVAYKNYLLELRSFQDRYDKKNCCVCLSKEKLVELARDVLPRLEQLK